MNKKTLFLECTTIFFENRYMRFFMCHSILIIGVYFFSVFSRCDSVSLPEAIVWTLQQEVDCIFSLLYWKRKENKINNEASMVSISLLPRVYLYYFTLEKN